MIITLEFEWKQDWLPRVSDDLVFKCVIYFQGLCLLTWINFNASMDK